MEAALEASRSLLSTLPSSEATTNVTPPNLCESCPTEVLTVTQVAQSSLLGEQEVDPIPITLVTQPCTTSQVPPFSLSQSTSSPISQAQTESISTTSAQVPPFSLAQSTSFPISQAQTSTTSQVPPFSLAQSTSFPISQA